MSRLLPPLCLFLALAMVVAGFAVWAVDPPEAGVELHRAGASGDDQYREALEAQVRRRQLGRKVLLGCLFVGGVAMIAAAFLLMRPAEADTTGRHPPRRT